MALDWMAFNYMEQTERDGRDHSRAFNHKE